MLLAVDVGNTQTVIGVFEASKSGRLLVDWRLRTEKFDAPDDIRVKIVPLFGMAQIDVSSIRQVVLASVVPSLGDAWREVSQQLWNTTPCICNAHTAQEAGLFKADYPEPSEIGADRVADAIAARYRFASPVIIVDLGTATNMEAISSDGTFMGGIIAPGMMTGAQALFSSATRLAATDLTAPGSPIGKSTAEALRSGIIYGEACRVDGLVRMMKQQMERIGATSGEECHVVATGGLADLVAVHSQEITDVVPGLTLEGLRLLAAEGREDLC